MRINREEKKTVILITHNEALARQTDRVVTIQDGMIISDTGMKGVLA